MPPRSTYSPLGLRLKPLVLLLSLPGWWAAHAVAQEMTPPVVAGAGGLQLQSVPALQDFSLGPNQGVAIFTKSDSAQGHVDQDVTLEGAAQMRHYRSVVKADHIHYDEDSDVVRATGSVRLTDNGNRFIGPQASLHLDAGDGFMLTPSYHIGATNGGGKAKRIDIADQTQIKVTDGTYSGCSCQKDPAWYFRAKEMDFDTDRGVGTAYNGVLFFQHVPILASPYLTFPLTSARRSGLLPPTFGQSSTSGFEFMQPYYFNIAPNRDLTFAPRILTKRGIQWNTEFRYLEPTYAGKFHIEYLNNDHLTGTNRYLYSLQHNQTLPFGVRAFVNYTRVSDSTYPQDFGANNFQYGVTSQYTQQAGLSWGIGGWSFMTQVLDYQTLAPNAPPYDIKPEFQATYNKYDWHGFDINVVNDYTNFRMPTPSASQPDGQRIYSKATVSYPFLTPGYYAIPKVIFNATSYQISNLASGVPNNINRTVPTLSFDTGLDFERNLHWFGLNLIQTLEPRLFYVYTPYRNQDAIPLFDTSAANFNMAEIFSENSFVGNDRISDANRITVGVTSRFINADTGAELARFVIAQRYNFRPSRVTLLPGGEPDDSTMSDVVVGASTQLPYNWQFTSDLQYSPNTRQVNQTDVGLTWRPGGRRVFNAYYHYLPVSPLLNNTEVDQIQLSAQWPLTRRIGLAGSVTYAPNTHNVVDALAGFEYDADCWAFRIAFQRYTTSLNTSNTGVFAQLELKGLSKTGTSVTRAFQQAIPGYAPQTPTPIPSRFTNYE
ncbi:hypothetical protein ABW99_13545 [Pandoraea thiooxydans]|nr:hypothetical protein ABW99_13545 [Pandoraea thiooxydans]